VRHSDTVVRNMRDLRRIRGWSGEELARRMTEQGVSWRREIVANLENGRRGHVSVDEWLTLAQVFEVPAAQLLAPDGGAGSAKLADVAATARDALTDLRKVIHGALVALDDVGDLLEPRLT
jgi:transcriptional regulator with XRE-family HTH domain